MIDDEYVHAHDCDDVVRDAEYVSFICVLFMRIGICVRLFYTSLCAPSVFCIHLMCARIAHAVFIGIIRSREFERLQRAKVNDNK